jgi:hypothetical protein
MLCYCPCSSQCWVFCLRPTGLVAVWLRTLPPRPLALGHNSLTRGTIGSRPFEDNSGMASTVDSGTASALDRGRKGVDDALLRSRFSHRGTGRRGPGYLDRVGAVSDRDCAARRSPCCRNAIDDLTPRAPRPHPELPARSEGRLAKDATRLPGFIAASGGAVISQDPAPRSSHSKQCCPTAKTLTGFAQAGTRSRCTGKPDPACCAA